MMLESSSRVKKWYFGWIKIRPCSYHYRQKAYFFLLPTYSLNESSFGFLFAALMLDLIYLGCNFGASHADGAVTAVTNGFFLLCSEGVIHQ